MDPNAVTNVALLAIRPIYANQILSGSKRVEFRKAFFRQHVSHVLIYASKPTMRVVGCFEVSGRDTDSPGRLWNRYKKVGGISKEDYDDYYSNTDKGVAIQIGKVWPLKHSLALSDIDDKLRPPQNYIYLPSDVLDLLQPNYRNEIREKS
ncbi:MAG TPA: ASCH domain-containing protein [Candidatus Sumerlaeota bacterium]|nr:ASCH domain-containing protein [Candidatus Sumerlaeota bacterium]